jgi:hypothetical protein
VDGDGQPDQLTEGAEVTTWADKAGGDHNATGGNPPTYAAIGLNGKPSLHFDGTTDWLAFPAINDVRTVFWVVTPTSTNNSRHFFLSHSSAGDFYSDGTEFWRSNASNAVKNGDTYLNGAQILGTQTNVPIGDPFVLSVVTTGNVKASQLGRDRTNHGRSWQGEMSEILIYDAALSSLDRSRVETYLAVKWGLEIAQAPPGVFAAGANTTTTGRAYLLDMMNLREATAQEVTRAKEGATPGIINQFEPTFKVGPGERPEKVNEYGFDTGATSGFWVVPK